MKKIFEIYKDDIRSIFKNYAAIIVLAALCIIPSLYAWFNIKASWDPYSQDATSGIKVGVVNLDKGANFSGKDINIGDEVIGQLKDNKQLGWQFVSAEEAERNVENGNYYASITIPENFSKDLTSILSDNVTKGEIIYTVNEKINAIAPKITVKGATALQEQVSKSIVETVSNAIFGFANEVGIQLEEQIPKITTIYNSLVKIQGSFGDINNTVDKAADGAEKIQTLITEIQNDIPKIQDTLTNAQNLSSEVQNFITSSQGAVEKLSPTIKQDIKIVNEVSKDIATYTEGVKNAINSGADNAPAMVDNLISKVNGLKSTADSVLNILNTLNKFSGGSLSDAIDSLTNISNTLSTALGTLNDIKTKVDSGVVIDLSLLDNIVTAANDIANITDGIYANYDSTIIPALNDTLNQAYNVAGGALDILKGAEAKLPQVQDILNTAYAGAQKGEEGIAFVKEALPQAEAMINDLVDKMAGISNEQELRDVVNLLKADVAKRSDFLANPVNIVENNLYPMGNYGTAMTPFYTVLSLWVGLTLLSSMLSVEKHGEYTPTQVYFGKLLLYLTIAIIQALIVALGDLYILKIYCVNPALFVAGIVFTSITFTFIVYSLVSVFGNVGKVLAIVLLVLQVAGSGGTFPIQLTPRFFQVINPFLPFTYSISFAREAIGGVVQSVLTKDIIVSLIYIVVAVLVAILLKKPINKLSEGFVENFKKSGIGE